MFNLIYRDGAPENTGHYEKFTTGADLMVGQLVSVSGGAASAYKAGDKPYGIVAASAAANEDVAVLKITDDMIFRAPLTTGSAKKQGQIAISVNGVGGTASGNYAFEVTNVVSSKVVEGRFITKTA
jgi:hypothetical protein